MILRKIVFGWKWLPPHATDSDNGRKTSPQRWKLQCKLDFQRINNTPGIILPKNPLMSMIFVFIIKLRYMQRLAHSSHYNSAYSWKPYSVSNRTRTFLNCFPNQMKPVDSGTRLQNKILAFLEFSPYPGNFFTAWFQSRAPRRPVS